MILYLTKTCFGFVAAKLKASSSVIKSSDLVFRKKHAVLSFIGRKICFGHSKRNWASLSFILQKTASLHFGS